MFNDPNLTLDSEFFKVISIYCSFFFVIAVYKLRVSFRADLVTSTTNHHVYSKFRSTMEAWLQLYYLGALTKQAKFLYTKLSTRAFVV